MKNVGMANPLKASRPPPGLPISGRHFFVFKSHSVREEVLRLFSVWVRFPPRDGKASALSYRLRDAPEKQGIILVRVHSQFCGHGILLRCCRVYFGSEGHEARTAMARCGCGDLETAKFMGMAPGNYKAGRFTSSEIQLSGNYCSDRIALKQLLFSIESHSIRLIKANTQRIHNHPIGVYSVNCHRFPPSGASLLYSYSKSSREKKTINPVLDVFFITGYLPRREFAPACKLTNT
jgi:hypothetical protein